MSEQLHREEANSVETALRKREWRYWKAYRLIGSRIMFEVVGFSAVKLYEKIDVIVHTPTTTNAFYADKGVCADRLFSEHCSYFLDNYEIGNVTITYLPMDTIRSTGKALYSCARSHEKNLD